MTVIELANRIIDIDLYEAQDTDTTPEMIADAIKNDPEPIIEYLLDVIDDLL